MLKGNRKGAGGVVTKPVGAQNQSKCDEGIRQAHFAAHERDHCDQYQQK